MFQQMLKKQKAAQLSGNRTVTVAHSLMVCVVFTRKFTKSTNEHDLTPETFYVQVLKFVYNSFYKTDMNRFHSSIHSSPMLLLSTDNNI